MSDKLKITITTLFVLFVTFNLLTNNKLDFLTTSLDSFKISAESMLANFLSGVVTEKVLLEKYEDDKIKILLIPGHDNEYVGTVDGDLSEADANLAIAEQLYYLLSKNPQIEVLTIRDFENGDYTQEFEDYLVRAESKILAFMKERRQSMSQMLDEGDIEKNVTIDHHRALDKIAFRLYGVNKWANENNIDIQLHIHLNDYGGRKHGSAGKYSGFAIYVPEQQFPNSKPSRQLASEIKNELQKFLPASDYPKESGTIIEAQELIALGSNASQKSASVLVEYGYIYEPQFKSQEVREIVFKLFAELTYTGLVKYFGENYDFKIKDLLANDESVFSYSLKKGLEDDDQVALLQLVLRNENVYPPAGRSFNDCPISGNFGPCTEEAVVSFQEKYSQEILSPVGLDIGTGHVGQLTLNKLIESYWQE